MAPLLKHNSTSFHDTRQEELLSTDPTTLEGERHCWARPGGDAHGGRRTPGDRLGPPALPRPLGDWGTKPV